MRKQKQLSVGDALGNGRYVLVERLGEGALATVWRARDERDGADVAIKALDGQVAKDARRREAFFRSVRVMASLSHPGIVKVLEAEGHERDCDYFVMELMRGGTLRDAVAGGRLKDAGIVPVIVKVADALGAAHAKRHVHRDVKPTNILLDEHGDPKLVDFDVADGPRTGAPKPPVYAAPEAILTPEDAGPAADIYSLAITAAFCFLGRDPSPREMKDPEKMIRGLDCSPEVRAALYRATARSARDRLVDLKKLCEIMQAPDATVPPELPPGAVSWTVNAHLSVEQGEDRFGRHASFRVGDVVHRMRWVPPGTFLMGSPAAEAGRSRAEGPQHPVEIARGFWLGETPCTQALWQAVMGDNPSQFVSPERPVERVSWDDCQAFFAKLNAMVPGLGARLPTEAEWEYACRGGTTGATWVGELDVRGVNNIPTLDPIALYPGNSGDGFELGDGWDSSGWRAKQVPHTRAGTRPVRGKAPNPYGLHDMLGNVDEWCADWFDRYPGGATIDGPGLFRVLRGGSWAGIALQVRAASRSGYFPGHNQDTIGFRLASSHE